MTTAKPEPLPPPAPGPTSPVRSALLNSTLLASSVLLGMLLCEFTVRIVAPQQLRVLRPDVYRPDDVFGWRHRENVQTSLNTGERTVHFRTDASGHRIPWKGTSGELQPAVRILALGDSFLEATAIEAESTIPELLKARLELIAHGSVTVDNSGVGGWDPNHYLLEAKRSLAKDKYDLGIVFLYIGNDIVNERVSSYRARQPSGGLHRFRLPRSLVWKEWITSIAYPINDFMKVRSHL